MRFALALLLPVLLPAQTTGTISGRIFDQTGQAVPGVRVTAANLETGLQRTVQSNAAGQYVVPLLPAGRYQVRAELEGFRPFVRAGIRLTVAETLAVDLTLEVGPVETAITVNEDAPLVNTQTSELSYLVGDEAIRQLPLNGRNYTDLALLQPGVVAFPNRDGGSIVAHGLGMSVNGQDPRANVYLLDGTPQNDFTNGPAGSAASTALGTETIREFRVETNAYSAEFGRMAGGQINALTKSGSNELHGSLFYFHRNDNLDARNFFDGRKPEFKRNQYGGSLGGPLRKNRTFYFAGYEGLRENKGVTVYTVVPDAASRALPADPAVRPYLDEFPLPNGRNLGGGLADYLFGFNQRIRQDFGQARVDHALSPNHLAFVRYTADDAVQHLPTDFPQFPRAFVSRNQFVTAQYDAVLSPSTLSALRAAFSRTRIQQDVEANTSRPLPEFVAGRGMMGDIDIGGMPRFGPQSSVNVRLTQNVYNIEEGLTLIRGRHTLKAGGLAERYQSNMYNPTFSIGIFTFADLAGFLANRPIRFIGLSPEAQLDRYWRFTLFALYLQDDFRVLPRLTLNIGLRYEFTTQPKDIYGRDAALINLTDPQPTLGLPFRNPTKRNISPRFGFAWDVLGDGSLSLRGGYGWFFNTNNHQNLIVTTNPPATPRYVIANPSFPSPDFARGSGNSIRPIEWNLKNPNVHVWNLGIQRRLWRDAAVTAGYAGARGVHLLRNTDVNVPRPQVLSDGTVFYPANAVRPYPSYSTIEMKVSDGNSWYNAFLLEFRKRWGSGVSAQSSYTFSRNIDTTQGGTFFSDTTNGTISAFPEFPGFSYNKGLADFHSKHNWMLNFTWELPFARRLDGAAGLLLKDWQLAGIANVRSGQPLTAFVQRNRSRSLWSPSIAPGVGFDRPSMAPGRTHQDAVLGGPDRYFDPSAFILQPAGTLGNLGRGALIGPDLRILNFAMLKNFKPAKLGDSTNIQFRAEFFNLFNHTNFSSPGLIAFAGAQDREPPLPSLGRIRSTVTSSRQIQLGLRMSF
ncbi:MAG: TonB-dependent receptor [Bryobacteraceae bacterium]|nr:TonB-dependent receptor [Bryobacteraceae bacterium]